MNVSMELLTLIALAIGTGTCENLTASHTEATNSHLTIDYRQPQISSLERMQRTKSPEIEYNQKDYEIYREGNPQAVEIFSENYPMPYPPGSRKSWNVTVENATGIELVLHFLDINPTGDFLTIRDGNQPDKGLILTGKIKTPLRMRHLHETQLTIEFESNKEPNPLHNGFLLTYVPYGNITAAGSVSPPPEEITIAPENVRMFSVFLSVPQSKQINATWDLCRHLLCQAADNFTLKYNLTVEQCHPSNVTLISIQNCNNLLPDSENCVEINFSITLQDNQTDSVSDDNPLLAGLVEFPEELTEEHLATMWQEFGSRIFIEHNLPEFRFPNASGLVVFWSGMAIAAMLVLILFLVIVSKVHVLRDYVHWPAADEDNQNILKNSQDIDITMFPSPHQIVPTLFPISSNAYSPGSSFLYEGDVYDNRPRDLAENFNETDPSLLSRLRNIDGNSLTSDDRNHSQ